MDKIRHQYLRLSQELSNYVIIVVNYNVNGREDGRKTKDREGVCRRCGSEIPLAERRFVLCPSCRENLRLRKASRAAQGRCVHCSGPLDASILSKENEGNNNGDEQNNKSNEDQNNELRRGSQEEKPARGASHKVCQRCREMIKSEEQIWKKWVTVIDVLRH